MARLHQACAAAAVVAGGVLMATGWTLLDSRPVRDEGALPAALRTEDPGRAAPPPSPPVALAVSGPHRLHVTVAAVAATREGDLDLPEDGGSAGWWALGAAPGAPRGTVLLAGHLDTPAGPGSFEALHDVGVGTRVQVNSADGRVHAYRVTARRTYPRAHLPDDLFSAAGPARLALLTCAGDYDPEAGQYDENLVLYAAPAPAAGPPPP
ncbi:class F sortase [Streptomyces sp. NPDC126503]|uniref:class F sortase n=1 Tax=Streptomyces sp. NPDC126503 TaxID=3155315 RepID=UPI00332A3C69